MQSKLTALTITSGTRRTARDVHWLIPWHRCRCLDRRGGVCATTWHVDSATLRHCARRRVVTCATKKIEFADEKCILCDECLLVRPVAGCIVEIAGMLRDTDERVEGCVSVQLGKTDSLYYSRLWIDQDRCARCGRGEEVCPVNAISIQKVCAEWCLVP